MKKFLTFFSAITFFTGTTLVTTACGITAGLLVPTKIDAPKQAKTGEDPLKEYVYNGKYSYDDALVKLVIARAAQMVSDRIRADQSSQKEFNTKL